MKAIHAVIFIFLTIFVTQGLAAKTPRITFSVKALFKDHVMLEINGEQHLLSAGDVSPEGIKLVSSNAREANLICHGEEFTLYINQSAYVSIAEEGEPPLFDIPDKIVPGNTVAFNKEDTNGVLKYTLKAEYSKPSVIEDGQDAIWIGADKKLLRFDIEKEAWGAFDLSDNVISKIDKLSVSDNSVVLKTSKMVEDRRHYSLSLFDVRTRKFYEQLAGIPSAYQFIDDQLWFLDSGKGLGFFEPGKYKKNTSYADALLYKKKPEDKKAAKTGAAKPKEKNERANKFSADGDDIWYSHYSRFSSDDWRHRLGEPCVSRFNKKRKTLVRYTRKEMGLDEKINCLHLAVAEDEVWVSHGNRNAGLSVFDTATGKWKHMLTSANSMLIGGDKILLENGKLLMLGNNQLIALDTKTFHASVLLGDAVVKNQWNSAFHASDGYVWYATQEPAEKNQRKVNFVLYKIPMDSAE